MYTWILTSAIVGAPVAVVNLGAVPADSLERVRAAEPGAMTEAEMIFALTGTDDPRQPSAESLRKMLQDARDREARFDTAGANELRAEIRRAFEQCIRPSAEIRSVAAQAAQDEAAGLLAEKDESGALSRAVVAVRTFRDTPLDATRHPPPVLELFARARKRLANSPHSRLRVEVDMPGTVLVDGFSLGRVETAVERDLPVGQYRVWWADDDGSMSLPHRVELASGGTTVQIAASHEKLVHIHPVVSIECDEPCSEQLRQLGLRLGVDRVMGVREGSAGLSVDVASGAAEAWPRIEQAEVARSQFRPWYLVPLGVGQFAQDRPLFGATYAAAQVGLGIWAGVALYRHEEAKANRDFGNISDLEQQRLLSATLFWSSVGLSVAEALIVGWLTGD